MAHFSNEEMALDSYKITVEGKQFKKSYIIYVVELVHNKADTYFYIGQTGDRHYLTARPPFRRLAGHLDDQGNSTQNQLYKAIATQILKINFEPKKKFPNSLKVQVSGYLENSEINMHIHPVRNFDENIDKRAHKENVKYIESVERSLIIKMAQEFGHSKILNMKRHKPYESGNSESVAENIFQKMKVEIKN